MSEEPSLNHQVAQSLAARADMCVHATADASDRVPMQAQTDLSRSGNLIRHPLKGWAHWVETGFRVLQCEDGLKHHGAQAACVCTLP